MMDESSQDFQRIKELELEVENLKMVCRRLTVAKTLEMRDKVADLCKNLYRGEITRSESV